MIPKHAILPDHIDDEAKSILVKMDNELTWTKRKLNLRDDLVKLLSASGYVHYIGCPYRYCLHGVGNSYLYDVTLLVGRVTNTERHRVLIADLTEQGYECIEGEGVDPNGEWPGEISVLVLDIDRASAECLGSRYDQNAVVWIDTDAIPRLLVLR